MPNINKSQKLIDALRKRYYVAAQGKEHLIKLIAEAEVAEQVYNSNAIENSTLTLEETDKILLRIDLERYINEREIFEAKNLARVVEYINTKAKERELDLDMILLLHKMLISNIDDSIAGRFRYKEWVRVGTHIAPSPEEVLPRLNTLLAQYYGYDKGLISQKIADFHLGFEYIHPFVDGNGRIGRVLNNYLLIREGFVPINIQFADRGDYYKAFKEFESAKSSITMDKIVTKALINSYYKRLAYLENKSIIKLSDFAKTSGQSYSGLLNKANRQTIEAFLDRGVWKIGV